MVVAGTVFAGDNRHVAVGGPGGPAVIALVAEKLDAMAAVRRTHPRTSHLQSRTHFAWLRQARRQ